MKVPIAFILLSAAALAGCAGAGPGEQVAPGAELVEIYAARKFFEAPVWDRANGVLYFDAYSKPADRLVRWLEPGKVEPQPGTEGCGGTFLGADGRILAADCRGHRILSFAAGANGLSDPKVLADDASWHQPNDLCQTPSGDIYFTDPDFKGKKAGGVYNLTPAGAVAKVVDHLPCPNGIIASLDGRWVYVGDSHLKQWWRFPVRSDGLLGKGGVFFQPTTESKRSPDGMTIDEFGNLYFTGLGGVWIVSPSGAKLDFISVPEFASNVTFGGRDGRTLFITCSRKVYSLAMRVRGGRSD